MMGYRRVSCGAILALASANLPIALGPRTKLLAGSAVAALLLGCSSDETGYPEEDWEPRVTWSKLADGSLAWRDDSAGFNAERCWPHANGYRCVQVNRFSPRSADEITVDVGEAPTTFYGRFTRQLETQKVYPSGGYSCQVSGEGMRGMFGPEATESITLSTGATISNELRDRSSPWSQIRIRDYMTANARGDAPIVTFNCVAVSEFLKRANEKALLTTALSERDLFGTRD
jgi:hypothetical protein